MGDFTGGVSGKYLGWAPKVTAAGAGATAGAVVASGIETGNGLKTSSQLGFAAAGHAKGAGSLGADLDLRLPAETAAGDVHGDPHDHRAGIAPGHGRSACSPTLIEVDGVGRRLSLPPRTALRIRRTTNPKDES